MAAYGGAWLEERHQSSGLSIDSNKRVVSNESKVISQIAKTVGPSVVSIDVAIGNGEANAAGTGIILSSSGIIVTNRHVVPAGTSSVSVTLADGTELKDVSVIGRTTASDSLDIAFLKVNAGGHRLLPARLGDSSLMQVGDNVIAIGNALGQFQNTVTSGIVSGFGRNLQANDSLSASGGENLVDLIQTDAAINEGNSGGPLVNLNGQVIGINTAVAGDAQNLGFAIPINSVRGSINQVISSGKFARPYLGVRYVPIDAAVADEFHLKVSQGAYILSATDSGGPTVLPNSPAAKAGLMPRDVIVKVGDTKIDQTHSLSELLGEHQPGDKVTLTVLRGGKTLTFEVTLGTLPGR